MARRAGALRTAAAGVAVVCALAGAAALSGLSSQPAAAAARRTTPTSWLTAGFNVMRTGYNGHETTIGEANAHRLHMVWSRRLSDVMIAQPVEAASVDVHGALRDVIYEGTEHGEFYAIDAATGHILWRKDLGSQLTHCADMPDHVFGIGSAGAISFTSQHGGVVYVAGGRGAVHAFNLATGAEKPGWPVRRVFYPRHETVYSGLNLFDGRLYVAVASHCDDPPYYGGVTEIGVARHAILHHFYPAGPPSKGISGGGIWGPGGVSVDPSDHDVLTATGNAKLPKPQNYGYSEAVVDLDQSLHVLSEVKPPLMGGDADFGSTPVLFRPSGCPTKLAAAENKDGGLFVYSVVRGRLGSRHRQRLQIANIRFGIGGFKGDPAWDPVTNMLYVNNTSNSSSGPFRHGIVALKAHPNCSLSLAWQHTEGPTNSIGLPPPTIANGVVYVGNGSSKHELAFDAATGRELWHSSIIKGPVYAPATIVNGMLFVASWDHKLYGFGVAKH